MEVLLLQGDTTMDVLLAAGHQSGSESGSDEPEEQAGTPAGGKAPPAAASAEAEAPALAREDWMTKAAGPRALPNALEPAEKEPEPEAKV
jgi:hypothetical protein